MNVGILCMAMMLILVGLVSFHSLVEVFRLLPQ